MLLIKCYLENSRRCYLATIANYSIVCYKSVLSTSCLLAAVTANHLLFCYDFLNLFSYLFKIKLLHFRVSKTKFRFSFIMSKPTSGENLDRCRASRLAYSTHSYSRPNVESGSQAVYTVCRKRRWVYVLCVVLHPPLLLFVNFNSSRVITGFFAPRNVTSEGPRGGLRKKFSRLAIARHILPMRTTNTNIKINH